MQFNLLGVNLVYHGPATSKLKEKWSFFLSPSPTASNTQTQYVVEQEHINNKTFRAVAKQRLLGLSSSIPSKEASLVQSVVFLLEMW